MTHHEQLGLSLLHRSAVELKRSLIEPSRPGPHVVFEGKPEVRELLNFSIVRLAQIYYVGYSKSFQLLHMRLGFDCASEREPFAHEEGFHWLRPL